MDSNLALLRALASEQRARDPIALIFRCRGLAMTPYLAGGARRRRGGRMIDRRERPSSIVRPEPKFSSSLRKNLEINVFFSLLRVIAFGVFDCSRRFWRSEQPPAYAAISLGMRIRL